MDTAGKAGRENQTEAFCRSYLRCLDPEQAARAMSYIRSQKDVMVEEGMDEHG